MLDEELQVIIASLATREDIRADASGCAHMDVVFGGLRREIQLLIEHIERSLKP